jgi:hypothetical protein
MPVDFRRGKLGKQFVVHPQDRLGVRAGRVAVSQLGATLVEARTISPSDVSDNRRSSRWNQSLPVTSSSL